MSMPVTWVGYARSVRTLRIRYRGNIRLLMKEKGSVTGVVFQVAPEAFKVSILGLWEG